MKVVYFLSYDLIKSKDYQKIYDELQKFGAKRVLESVWCFKYPNGKSDELRDHFKNFIDEDDRVLIMETGDKWASFRAENSPNKL